MNYQAFTSYFQNLSPVSRQLIRSVGFLLSFIFLSAFGFFLLGKFYLPTVMENPPVWSPLNCLYMLLITVTTAGYGEILPHMNLPGIRIYTTIFLFITIGATVYFASTMTTFFVEGAFSQVKKRRKMQKKIDLLDRHIIVCGLGNTGIHVVKELMVTHWPVMVVDIDLEILKKSAQELSSMGELIYLQGDALEDNILEQAGICRAYGIVCALPTDKDNVFLTLTARQMNPGIRIVSRAIDLHAAQRMKIAGADSVVTTNFIGGMRLASEMIRLHVTQFLDQMLRDKEKNLRVEELTVTTVSGLDGKRLGDANLRDGGQLLVLAVRGLDGTYEYRPGPDYVLKNGLVILVMGDPDAVARLRRRMTGIPVVLPENGKQSFH